MDTKSRTSRKRVVRFVVVGDIRNLKENNVLNLEDIMIGKSKMFPAKKDLEAIRLLKDKDYFYLEIGKVPKGGTIEDFFPERVITLTREELFTVLGLDLSEYQKQLSLGDEDKKHQKYLKELVREIPPLDGATRHMLLRQARP